LIKIPKSERRPKKLPASFYQTSAGAEPVRDWLKALGAADRRTIGEDIATLEFAWPVGMPVCRPMGDGLFEVRSALEGNRIARVLFCTTKDRIVLLHAFVKKTQKTPAADLALARKRKKEIEA
jgi:phage-related protein